MLGGSGLSWQDAGDGPTTHAVGPGDCLVHLVLGEAHTLHAGEDGLDVLAFGQRTRSGGARLPRAGLSWYGPSWVRSGGAPSPWEGEALAGRRSSPRRRPGPARSCTWARCRASATTAPPSPASAATWAGRRALSQPGSSTSR